MKYPGKFGKPFKIVLDANWFKKGDVIVWSNYHKGYVTKVYRMTWWRRLLKWLGFKVKLLDFTYKVQQFKDDNLN